ncbi:MAG: hypothetical protein C0433_05895 [Cyclobacterium sp.]|nr:hypothetical protein [Cyclobacterium sp.]
MFQLDTKRNVLNPNGSIKNGFEWDSANPECYRRIENSEFEGSYFLTEKKVGQRITVKALTKKEGIIDVGDYLYLVNDSCTFLGKPTEFSKNSLLFTYKLISKESGQVVHFKYKSRTRLAIFVVIMAVILSIMSQMGS